MKRYLFGVFIALSFSLWYCKTSPPLIPRAELKEMPVTELIRKLDSAACPHPYLATRFSAQVKVKGQAESQFKGKLRLQKDSVLWTSIVPALGIEVARLMATPHQAELINYINREYLVGSYGFLSDLADFPVTFKTLMMLAWPGTVLLHPAEAYQVWVRGGQFFLCPVDYKTLDKIISEKTNALPATLRQPFVQAVWISPQNLQPTRMLVYDLKQNRLLEVRRDEKNYTSGSCPVPTRQELRFQSDSTWVQVHLEFSKTEFPPEGDFPFNIPENFTRKDWR